MRRRGRLANHLRPRLPTVPGGVLEGRRCVRRRGGIDQLQATDRAQLLESLFAGRVDQL